MSNIHVINWQEQFYSAGMSGLRVNDTVECLNFSMDILPDQRIISHEDLPINWEYLKTELKWYANADYRDESIADHASQWNKVRNPDGFWNSNYGYWLWGLPQQLRWVIEELYRNPQSRRAIAHINAPMHLSEKNKDIPCTMYMNFHVRESRLYMSVHMRSQDAVWGLRNDLPFFWLVFDVVAQVLQLPQAYLHYSADSLHVYERHFEKVQRVLDNPEGWQECRLNTDTTVDKIIREKLQLTPRRLYGTDGLKERSDVECRTSIGHTGNLF